MKMVTLVSAKTEIVERASPVAKALALACLTIIAPAVRPHAATTARLPARLPPAALAPPVVTVRASEYAFDAPAAIASGPTTFRLIDAGRTQHFLGLVKIASPHTVADYRRVVAAEPNPPWVVSVGGVGTLEPGEVATTTLDLEPGLYAMICDMTDAHGVPHYMMGMLRGITVLTRRNGATPPPPDVEIGLADFAFVVPATIPSGRHVMGVRNGGTKRHMALVWRLAQKASVRDVLHWLDTPSDTSHPVTLLGGVPDLAPGRAAQILVDLEPGRYVLICLVQDPRDQKAHYEKGMVKELEVVPMAEYRKHTAG